MMSKIFLMAMLCLTTISSQDVYASSINCRAVKTQHRELGEIIHPKMLGNLYAKAMLKIAEAVVLENFKTFEDAAKNVLQNATNESLQGIKSNAKNFNYWQKSRRISNADFLMVAPLLAKELTSEELGALHLIYLANKNESRIVFSEILYSLISQGQGTILVMAPQLQQAMLNYSTSCLQLIFEKNQLAKVLNKLNKAVADNLSDVTIEGDEVKLGRVQLVKLPFLKVVKKKYDEDRVEPLQIGQRLLSEVGGSFNSYRQSNAIIHGVSNLETIKHFHKFYGLSEFAVLSKKNKTITVFDDSAQVLRKISVNVSSLDDRMNAGGAGIYYGLIDIGNVYYAKALSDNGMREVFRGKQPLDLRVDGPLYILPEEVTAHKFRIKNKRLAFSSFQFYRKSRNYNYSIDAETQFKVTIRHNYKSKFVSAYISTLEREKLRLMEILKVDNDDYNILSGFAIGVLAPESDFGKNWKYLLKEFLPGVVSLSKGNGFDTSKNSRGPTQLKVIPEEVMEQYGITKTNLTDPENAAVATIAISADFLRQLRNVGINHQLINEENIQNYLYYLYQGKRVQIKEALATPDDNLAIRKIMSVVNGLEFLEY